MTSFQSFRECLGLALAGLVAVWDSSRSWLCLCPSTAFHLEKECLCVLPAHGQTLMVLPPHIPPLKWLHRWELCARVSVM